MRRQDGGPGGTARGVTSIAIPDSCLGDDSTSLDKSRKVADIARACAVFGVGTVYVYDHGGPPGDRSLLTTILRYMDTPQFLRKRLFPRMNELKYAGVLHPLRIPSHITPADSSLIRAGMVRDGVVVKARGRMFADFGINTLLPYRGGAGAGRRITGRFSSGAPDFRYSEIRRSQAPAYWGYEVRERGPLRKFLSTWNDAVILTSRKGRPVTMEQVRSYQGMTAPLLVVYGSTNKGIHEILGNPEGIPNSRILDFFPGQATETVRLEEAVLGTLAILNMP